MRCLKLPNVNGRVPASVSKVSYFLSLETIKGTKWIAQASTRRTCALTYMQSSQEFNWMRTASNLDAEMKSLVRCGDSVDLNDYVDKNINDQHYSLIEWGVLEYYEEKYVASLQQQRNIKKDSPAVIEAKKLYRTCAMVFYDVFVMGLPLKKPLSPGQSEAIIRNMAHLSVKVLVIAGFKAEYVAAYGKTLEKNGEPSGKEKRPLTIHEENLNKKRKKTDTPKDDGNKGKKRNSRGSVGSSNEASKRPISRKQSTSTKTKPIDTGIYLQLYPSFH